jgi:peptidase MA superfamily protein
MNRLAAMARIFYIAGISGLALLLALATAAWAGGPPHLAIIAPSPELAAHVKQVADRAAPRLTAWTGAAPKSIRIEVAVDHLAFERRVKQLGGPRWAAGLAWPQRNLILLRSPRQLGGPEQFAPLLQHELVHLYLAAGLKGRRAPLWLEEGLSMLLSGEGGWARTSAMTRAVLGGKLLPLSELEHRFPTDHREAALAYAQSYYLITWLLNNYGDESLRVIVASLAQDRPLTAALRRATGLSLASMQKAFSDDMSSRFSWLALLTAGGTVWGLIGIVAIVGLVIRRRRQKRRIAQGMAREDEEEAQALPRRRQGRASTKVLQEAGLARDESKGNNGASNSTGTD